MGFSTKRLIILRNMHIRCGFAFGTVMTHSGRFSLRRIDMCCFLIFLKLLILNEISGGKLCYFSTKLNAKYRGLFWLDRAHQLYNYTAKVQLWGQQAILKSIRIWNLATGVTVNQDSGKLRLKSLNFPVN